MKAFMILETYLDPDCYLDTKPVEFWQVHYDAVRRCNEHNDTVSRKPTSLPDVSDTDAWCTLYKWTDESGNTVDEFDCEGLWYCQEIDIHL